MTSNAPELARERKTVIPYRLEDVAKIHQFGESSVVGLRAVDLTIEEGEFIAIVGPSGSGKSTLLNLLGLLDRPTSGRLLLDGVDVSGLRDDALADLRLRQLGFIFQSFNLIASLTAWENVAVPGVLAGHKLARSRARATELLDRVGLADRTGHRPAQLSGGQMQRVAIARALLLEPRILLADEPTGNLDSTSGAEVLALLRSVASSEGRTVLVVTHDPEIARQADRVISLKDGAVVAHDSTDQLR
jgi:putative ABC transport system ATP-binding protein